MKFVRIIFFLMFLLFGNHACFSQEKWEVHYGLSLDALENGNINLAKKYANTALVDLGIIITNSETKKNKGIVLTHLGFIYHTDHDMLNAKKNYLQAEILLEDYIKTGDSDLANLMALLGLVYEINDEFGLAEDYYIKAIEEYEIFGIDKLNHCFLLYSLGHIYMLNEDFDLAEPTLSFIVKTYNEERLTIDDVYISSLIKLGSIYNLSSDYDLALEVLLEAYEYAENDKVTTNKDLIRLLYQLGECYKGLGFWQESSDYLSVAIDFDKERLSLKEHSKLYYLLSLAEVDYYLKRYSESFISLNKISQYIDKKTYANSIKVDVSLLKSKLYLGKGNAKKGFAYIQKTEKLNEKNKNHYSTDYAYVLDEIAKIYYQLGRYNKALKTYEKSINIYGDLSSDKLIYSNVLINYAQLKLEMGDVDTSEDILLDLISRYEKNGIITRPYVVAINTLGKVYVTKSEFSKAELLLHESGKMQKALTGKEHLDYAVYLNNAGNFYFNLGNFSKAAAYLLESSEIIEKAEGVTSSYYATSLNNIAMLYSFINDFEEAENLLLSSLEIEKNNLGITHPDYGFGLYNLAKIYLKQKKYSLAEETLNSSLAIMEATYSKTHPEYMRVVGALGEIHMYQEKYDIAKIELEKSSATFKSIYSDNNEEAIWFDIKLAEIESNAGDFEKANVIFAKSLSSINENTELFSSYFSESEKAQYNEQLTPYFDTYYSFVTDYADKHPKIVGDLYNLILKQKGALLRSTLAMRKRILNSNNIELKNKYDRWVYLNKMIAENQSLEESKRQINIEVYKEEANSIERELTQFVQVNDIDVNWKDIQMNLDLDAVCIEFFAFNRRIKFNESVKEYYALVLTKEDEFPKLIKLCTEESLKKISGNIFGSDMYVVNEIYGTVTKPNQNLYKLIWKPIEAEINNKQKVYYSPSGLLHKIAFNGIQTQEGNFLINKYKLYPLFSTNALASKSNLNFDKTDKLLLFGGVNYNTESTTKEVWKYLEGTKAEVEKINSITNAKTMVFKGNDASEENFKENAQGKAIIHLATHGFFFPNPKEVKEDLVAKVVKEEDIEFRGGATILGMGNFTKSADPLMRSGLILARANDLWSEDKYSYKDDGVLTASEVSQMDLRGTKLVVLSACETGRGDINGNEGVYGLQRAFKISGVNKIIMSLWQVPDKETEEFMILFYKNLSKLGNAEQAFYQAQLEVSLNKAPYFWAAFVLLE